MRDVTPWMLIALLMAGPALAQDGDQPESDSGPSTESPEESPDPEPAPETEEPGPDADVPTEEAPAPVSPEEDTEPTPAPAPTPAVTPEPVPEPTPEAAPEPAPEPTEPAPAAEPDEPKGQPGRWDKASRDKAIDHKKSANAAPQLALFLGGQILAQMDPGFGAVGDQDRLQSFNWGLDVWVHPNIGVAMSWSDSNAVSEFLSDDLGSVSLRTETRVRSADISAKAMLAPRWLPVRPVARVGVGFYSARLVIEDQNVGSNLKSRTFDAATPYLRLGGGIEITSPRYFGRDHREPGATKKLRFGGGFSVEAGAQIGGGGSVAAAPSLNFGAPGRLDMGPWVVRIGGLIFF